MGKAGASVLGCQWTILRGPVITLLNRWHSDHTFANEREWNLTPTKQNKLIPKHLRTQGSPMKISRGSLLGWRLGKFIS